MSVIDHPSRGKWLNLLRAVDETPGPTVPALFGGDDVQVDDDVAEAFAHRMRGPYSQAGLQAVINRQGDVR